MHKSGAKLVRDVRLTFAEEGRRLFQERVKVPQFLEQLVECHDEHVIQIVPDNFNDFFSSGSAGTRPITTTHLMAYNSTLVTRELSLK